MKNIALITGASRGIGKELALLFARNGYDLILIALHADELASTVAEISQHYPACQIRSLAVDLGVAASIEQILTTFKSELSNIEVLINNAGFGLVKSFADMSLAEIESLIAVNVTSLTALTHAITPYLIAKQRGKILNVASIAAFMPGPYMAVYYATKSYVLSFTESIAGELKRHGVHVAVLCPGVTKTAFLLRSGLDKTSVMNGLMTLMTPGEVAAVAYRGLSRQQTVIVPGFKNRLTIFFAKIAPRRWAAIITGYLQGHTKT